MYFIYFILLIYFFGSLSDNNNLIFLQSEPQKTSFLFTQPTLNYRILLTFINNNLMWKPEVSKTKQILFIE